MKILKWSLLGFLVLIVIVLTVAGFFAAKVSDKTPMALDHNYLNRPKEKAPYIPFHVMKKGQNNYEMIKRSDPAKVASIRYDDDEFNYILRTLMYSNLLNQAGLTGGKTITARRTSFILKQGAFHLKQIVEVPQNPFGKYINVHIVFKLSVRDGKEKIEILSAKAGVFDIPKQMLEKKLKKAVDTYYRGTSRERIVQESVIELHTDEKGIFMEYRPYVFRKNLKKNSGGPAGIFLGNRGVRFER